MSAAGGPGESAALGPRPGTWGARTILLVTLALAALPCHGGTLAIRGGQGLSVTLDAGSGRYEIRSAELNLAFAGTLAARASAASVQHGSDALGAYEELQFSWGQPRALHGSIRTYATGAVALFAITAEEPLPDGAALVFPRFTELPRTLHAFSYQDREFAPPSFAPEPGGTPWLLFDAQPRAALISPASNFMIASMRGDGRGDIASALNAGVSQLPAGFTHRTLMAFGASVNGTWELWGASLARLQGAQRPANDADAGLRYLGYWTDNGAAYYYDYDRRLGYAGTLRALVQRYREEAIPIRYLQLDSWWYYKTLTDPDGGEGTAKNPHLPEGEWNRYGGLLRYGAHPALFPRGLAAFQQSIGLPLILHNRWIDPASPYRERYRISGVAALDPAWWRDIMGYVAAAGGVTYEQDWLNVIYERSPQLATTATSGEAFTGGMARAAQQQGLTLQYSMPLPRHFLEGMRYPNLTTIRVTPDRFGWRRWDAFLYTSRLASALGLWPWTDVFMSGETDNLLMATLSAGMLGIGDRIGAENGDNIRRAVRADGVIVKPDTPLVPLDAMYVADARAANAPMIACAHTDHAGLSTAYVFSYRRAWTHLTAAFSPAEVGVARAAYVYDARSGSAHRLAAADRLSFHLAPHATAYFVVVPIAHSGIALFGDAGKFVPDGRRRIASLIDEPEQLTAEVRFAPGEHSVRLFGYAPRRPTLESRAGSAGRLTFDATSGRFEVEVFPGVEQLTEGPGGDPEHRAVISFKAR